MRFLKVFMVVALISGLGLVAAQGAPRAAEKGTRMMLVVDGAKKVIDATKVRLVVGNAGEPIADTTTETDASGNTRTTTRSNGTTTVTVVSKDGTVLTQTDSPDGTSTITTTTSDGRTTTKTYPGGK